MKKPVWRLLNPNTIWYFVAMLLFAASAAVLRQYYLAGGALLATVIVFIISRAQLSRRKRELMSYVQKATDSAGISVHAGSAFPMAVIRLPDNEIIWGNPQLLCYHRPLRHGQLSEARSRDPRFLQQVAERRPFRDVRRPEHR